MRRVVAAVTTAAVVAGIGIVAPGGVTSAAADPASTVSASTASADVASRPDSVAAQVTARAQGHAVVDESATTPFTTVWANPNGSWTESTSPVPVQAQQPDGSWAPIRTTLATTRSGALVPGNVPDQVSFSGGGSTTAASMLVAGQKVSWLWPTALPAPTVSGPTATYHVSATEDLVLTATPTGFAEDVVLTARPTTRAEARITLPVQTGTATLHATSSASGTGGTGGELTVRTGHGSARLWASAPVAYDATTTATAADAAGGAPSGRHVSPLGVSVTPGTGTHTRLTLRPDWAWLTAATTKYPVTIDPTFASTTNGDTWVDDADPDLNRNGETYLQVGDDADSSVDRVLLQFSRTAVQNLAGEDVTSATLSLRNYLSHSCDAATIRAQRITSSWTAGTVTWDNQPTVGSDFAGFNPAYGATGCPTGTATWDVSWIAQGWADGSYPLDGIELQAANESNPDTFRSYRAFEYSTTGSGTSNDVPTLTVTYDRAPATPTTPKVTPVTSFTPTGSGSDTAAGLYTPTSTPKVSTTVSDPDGGTVQATFSFYTSKTGDPVASCTSGMVASGSAASCALGASSALGNGVYYVRATASDGTVSSANASAWTTVTIAQGRPAAPTISCDGQTNGTWAAVAPGGAVSCTIADAQTGYIAPTTITYTVDGVTHTVDSTRQDGLAPLIVASVSQRTGAHVLTAVATSPAGTTSATTTFAFGYGTLGLNAPTGSSATAAADTATDAGGSAGLTASSVVTTSGTVQVEATGPAQPAGDPNAYVEWRLAGSGQGANTGWTKGPALSAATDPATGGLIFTGAWDTTTATHDQGTDTDLDPSTPQLLEMQVCADYTAGTECTWGTKAGDAGAGTPATDVLRVAHAFGDDFPTSPVEDGGSGGQVALWTGEWQTSAIDATLTAGDTSLSVDRTASSYAGPSTDPADRVFGPGWTADLTGDDDAGYGSWQVIDDTLTQGVLMVDDGAGDTMVFAPSSNTKATGVAVPTRRTGATLTTGTWLPVDAETAQAGVVAAINTAGTTLTLTDPDGTTTVFTLATAPTATTAALFHPQSVTEPGNSSDTSYTYSGGLVTRILAPTPDGVTCPGVDEDDALPAGCRAIALSYATTTTATSATPGDYAGQVSSLELLVGTGTGADASTKATTVATYAYDTTGRLLTVTDPRDQLTTGYTYTVGVNEAGPVISSITPPGLTPIDYAYDTTGRLTQVTRQQDSTDSPAGTADLATIAYTLPTSDIANPADTTDDTTGTDTGVSPLASATLAGTGLPDLSGAAVASWDQPAGPTYAAAVFGPDHPLTLDSSGDVDTSGLSADDWTYASLSYTDDQGREINDAEYGAGRWLLTDTEYDSLGNPIRELDESDIAAVQHGTLAPQDAGTLTVYNAEVDGTDADGNPTVLLPADTETTDTYATARWVQLADGTTVWVRPHTHTDYDQGAPNNDISPDTGQDYALSTTVTTGAADPATIDTDPTTAGTTGPGAGIVPEQADLQVDSIVHTGYANAVPGGDVDAGWDQGLASSTSTVMDDSVSGGTAGATPIVSTMAYDAQGDTVSTSQPMSNGTDAGTRQLVYYTAAATSGVGTVGADTGATPAVAACDNDPADAGLLCQTRFAGDPATGPSMVTTTYHYDHDQQVTSTVETSTDAAGDPVTRTTTTGYDTAGRKTSTSTTVTGLPDSTPVPDTSYGYDPATGLPTTATPATGEGGPVTTGYDAWGRVSSYTTSTGTTTTSYDAAGNTATVTTPDGVTTTNTYDGGTSGSDAAGNVERRGLVTSMTATATTGPNAGATVTESGAYDPAGNLTIEDLPGGLSVSNDYDTAGQLTDSVYSGDVAVDNGDGTTTTIPNTPWIGWSQTYDPEGRVLDSWTPDGAALSADTTGAAATGYADAYTYDPAGRLVQVIDQTRSPGDGGLNADGTDPDTGTIPTDGSCVIRQYGFDADGNRTSLASIPAASDGTCQAADPTSDTGVTATTWTHDAADRTNTTGSVTGGSGGTGEAYAYDALGRVTTLPQADTPEGATWTAQAAAAATAGTTAPAAPGDLALGYYDTDTVASQTQAGQTTSYGLDAEGRVLTEATGPVGAAATSTITSGYTDTTDSPGWESTTTGTATSMESYVTGLDGNLAATLTSQAAGSVAQIAVNNPHGDIVAQITLPTTSGTTSVAAGLDDWTTTDEYGNPTDTATDTVGTTATNPGGITATGGTGGTGYGWLGAKQRATLDTGLVLMGARPYNPTTGQFTSPDPIYDGNTTPYAYPQDPINAYDLNGECLLCGLLSFGGLDTIGAADFWNPVGWAILGATAGYGVYVVGKATYTHFAHAKKTGAKNSGRGGHETRKSKSTSDKHTKAQGHGGQRKFVNKNKRRE